MWKHPYIIWPNGFKLTTSLFFSLPTTTRQASDPIKKFTHKIILFHRFLTKQDYLSVILTENIGSQNVYVPTLILVTYNYIGVLGWPP